jgi:hypothetical protein
MDLHLEAQTDGINSAEAQHFAHHVPWSCTEVGAVAEVDSEIMGNVYSNVLLIAEERLQDVLTFGQETDCVFFYRVDRSPTV